VGAQKAATSSIYYILNQHPDIYFPLIKEPTFFSYRNDRAKAIAHLKYFGYGKKYIKPMTELKAYVDLFKDAKESQLTGEASTNYLYDYNNTIKNIKELYGPSFSDVKIIIILRNPVKRAFSCWSMLVRNGNETLSLMEAIKETKERMEKLNVVGFDYIGFSLYYEQVKAYLNNFKNVKIILQEDFEKKPDNSIKEILDFLKVTEIDLNTKIRTNMSGIVKNKLFARLLYTDNIFKSILKPFIPVNMRFTMKSKIETRIVTKTEMTKEEQNSLRNLLKDDIRLLYSLIKNEKVLRWLE
jgi:hypothetical protein